jgi:hypothetical protein
MPWASDLRATQCGLETPLRFRFILDFVLLSVIGRLQHDLDDE